MSFHTHTAPRAQITFPPAVSVLSRVQRAGLALGLFLVVWSAKLVVIDHSGSDLPFWDQWAREGDVVYPAWFDRGELGRPLFTPHNEHRIAPTLALNLGLVAATGQWDARVQCVISGALHAAVLTGLFLWSLRRLPLTRALAAGVLLGLIGAAPIGWENILGGFQSQFYFLAGFSLLAIGGLLFNRAFSVRWWGGAVAGVAALVSMGSGFLCAGPIVFFAAMRLGAGEGQSRKRHLATLLVGVALLAAGVGLHSPMPGHEPLHARSLPEFLLYAIRCAAWPLSGHEWLAIVFWLPWLMLLAWRLTPWIKRGRDSAIDMAAVDFVAAAGLWVLGQILAVAYSRAGSGELPSSRYSDLLGVGLALSCLALALLAPRNRIGRTTVTAWWLAAAACLVVAARATWTGPLSDKQADRVAFEESVRAFVLTDDFVAFQKEVVPFPNHEWLARVLRNPVIRRILPASVRAPLRIDELGDDAALPLPPLAHRATRALLEAGEWQSRPLAPAHGWWKIETAGHLGTAGAALELIALADGRVLGSIVPSKRAADTWRAAYVQAPREPAKLVARTADPARWFAFSEPVEMSTTSYWSWQLTKHGALILYSAGLATLALVGAIWHAHRRPRVAGN